MLKNLGPNTPKPLVAETGNDYAVLHVPRNRPRETNLQLLRMMQALTSVIGAASVFTTFFAGLNALLNISSAILTITLFMLGGTAGYYAFKASNHK